MKTKYFFLTVLAGMTFAGCTDDDIAVEAPPPVAEEDVLTPISFSSSQNAFTRADFTGAEAAEKLGKQFVVFGYKGSSTANPGSTVFENYVVKYTENTANTTESNTTNWEYVGQERIKHAIDKGVTQQAIKYWDYTKDQYDFLAWSTGKVKAIYEGEPDDGEVLVSPIEPETATDPETGLSKAFTLKGLAKDLEQCYITDIVTVKKDGTGTGKYGETVTLKFRSLGTKVRIGIYETIPGYSVKDVKFYKAAAVDFVKEGDEKAVNGTYSAEEADAENRTPRLFTITDNDIYTQGEYTIYYPTVDVDKTTEDYNYAHVKFQGTGTQSTIVDFSKLNYTTREDGEKSTDKIYLGRTSNTATFAGEADGNYYTQYLPNESGSSLNLRVDYTLESIDGSGETITVRGATAQVPDIYTQWKAGFAYTYLFKISDKTNGYTGAYDPTKPDDTTVNSDPAGLYPITFDAVVVNDEEDATQETITLVSTPSITTYQNGSNVVNNNEYTVLTPSGKITGDIYVTVNDGTADETPDLANATLQVLTGKAALYTIPAGKTEAEVIDALKYQDPDYEGEATILGRSGLELTQQTLTLTDKVEYGADGNTINLADNDDATDDNKAAKFTPEAGKTYAFVYTKKAAETTETKYEIVNFELGDRVKGYYRYGLKNAPAGDVQAGVNYFLDKSTVVDKVFLGQTVNNLFLDNQGTQASGYAKTGTTYYYTVTSGMSYLQAYNVAYADFASTELYTKNGNTYTAKGTDVTEPQDGVAYYHRTGAGTADDPYVYTYCVILPQQTNPAGGEQLKIVNTNKARITACDDDAVALKGQTYFDKYTQNDGVYYTKVIKVQ